MGSIDMQPATSHAPAPAIATSVRCAGPDDVPALLALINEAYEVERFFVDGDRTDEEELADLQRVGHFLVLDRADHAGLAAAVFVRIAGERGYFGMLSVAPDLRGLGLGRRLVAVAEAMCEAAGCRAVDLQIVNLREELGPWYRSLGYHEVGTAPFGQPTRDASRPCFFIKMSKSL
jgi:ribosomal protein S18 acetylase RimI-like enzyme